MFRSGQKVVCVDDYFPWHARILGPMFGRWHIPVKDAIYTVLRMSDRLPDAVVLHEIQNFRLLDRAWRASRFRPLVTRQTDISVFTEMLASSDQEVDA